MISTIYASGDDGCVLVVIFIIATDISVYVYLSRQIVYFAVDN